MEQDKKAKTIGWAVSVGLHSAVLIVVAWFTYYVHFDIRRDVRVTGGSEPVPSGARRLIQQDEKPPLSDRKIAEQLATRDGMKQALDQAHANAMKMSDQEREKSLDNYTRRVEKIKPENVASIVSYIETSAGVPAQTQPAAAPGQPPKPFDPETAMITSLIKGTDKSGKTVYLLTLTDANGTALVDQIPPQDMTPEMLRLADLFERAKTSSSFNMLLRSSLRIANHRAKEQHAAQQPAAQTQPSAK